MKILETMILGEKMNKKIGIMGGIIAMLMTGMVFAQTTQGTITVTTETVAPVCMLGINSSSISFPTLYAGETVAPSMSAAITVTNESTFVTGVAGNPNLGISTGIMIEGTNWMGLNPSDTMPASQTSVLLGTYNGINPYNGEFSLTNSNSGDKVDLMPTSQYGDAVLEFGLSIPTLQPVDTYSQTISIVSTC
jgi:hypothetical protein